MATKKVPPKHWIYSSHTQSWTLRRGGYPIARMLYVAKDTYLVTVYKGRHKPVILGRYGSTGKAVRAVNAALEAANNLG
jgi:hypothetical protein